MKAIPRSSIAVAAILLIEPALGKPLRLEPQRRDFDLSGYEETDETRLCLLPSRIREIVVAGENGFVFIGDEGLFLNRFQRECESIDDAELEISLARNGPGVCRNDSVYFFNPRYTRPQETCTLGAFRKLRAKQ